MNWSGLPHCGVLAVKTVVLGSPSQLADRLASGQLKDPSLETLVGSQKPARSVYAAFGVDAHGQISTRPDKLAPRGRRR